MAGVTFGYSRRRPPVLRDFAWQVPSGRTVLLGPNGAGKSTILGIGAGSLRPVSGWCEVDGVRSDRRGERASYLRRVGWMPQHTRPIPGLRVHEQVAYAGWLQGMSRSDATEAARAALERVGLTNVRQRRSHELSGGQTRRMGLAEAIIVPRSTLLLDEPTAGLDPAERQRFRTILEQASQDADVVVSTHEVEDLTDSYDTVVVLNSGQIVFSGSVGAFLAHAPSGSRAPATDAYAGIVNAEGQSGS